MSNCTGSGTPAKVITDDGLAYDPDDALAHAKPALNIRSAELVLRFPKGTCFTCQDGADANTEQSTRDQQAWDLNVANGSANAAHGWAEAREHDAKAKAYDALALFLQVLAVIGFLGSLGLFILDIVKTFR